MKCSTCGTTNKDNFQYCIKCGDALAVTASSPVATSLTPHTTLTTTPSTMPKTRQTQTSISPFNIWGPFAGKGARRRHVGWLMEDQGQHATELITHIHHDFQNQAIPKTRMSYETLAGRGIGVEARPYFLLQRGLVHVGLYVSEFGRNLFISQVSYLKPPISNFRVVATSAMIVFQLFMMFIYPAMLSSTFQSAMGSAVGALNPFGSGRGGSDSGLGVFFTLLCAIGPLGMLNGIVLFIGFVFSVYKWLAEKDFFAALRVPPNEFNEDDLMAMEKAAEQTVRNSLTAIKLNPDDLQRTEIGRGTQLF